jgi:integrase
MSCAAGEVSRRLDSFPQASPGRKSLLLTDVSIRKTNPSAKRQEIRDDGAPGLYLIVQPTGAKSFAARYSREGKVLKTTIGPYPAVTLADARRQALQIAAAVASGADPQSEKRTARVAASVPAERTVKMVADEFLTRHTAEKNGARWAAETKRIIERNILPAIGDKAVNSVGKSDINDMLDTITDRGKMIAANRALAVAKKLYRWALSRNYVDRDPCAGIAKPGDETKRDRVLSDGELAHVWRAADGMGWPFGLAVRLLILTGARREEVGAMKWTEVDLAAKTWTLPAARAKNNVEHVIPLSDAALSILQTLPRIGKAGFVFTVTGRTPISGWSRAKAQLDKAILEAMRKGDLKAEPMAGWTIHDLRRTMATGLAGLGVALPVVEKILNHLSGSFGGVAGVYQRFAFADEKRQAVDRWAARVAVIVGE